MGAVSPSQSESSFYNSLELVRTIQGSRFLMRDPATDSLFVISEHSFPSQQQMHKFSADLHRKKQLSHQYYMYPEKQLIVSSVNLCSKHHKVVQIFRNQQNSLMDQIMSRREQGRTFSEREIWSILCSCVLVMSHFTKNEITHITLHPKDIVLTSEGQVKVLAQQLSQFVFDYTYKHGFYYAPETLKAISTRSSYNVTNKSGVFTLGMAILSAMLVEDLAYIYSEGSTIDYAEIGRKLEQVASQEMRNVLQKMLRVAPYERISFPQLEDMLYEILEKSEVQSQSGVQASSHQIEKLEESICRLRSSTEHNHDHLRPCEQDQQDRPNSHELSSDVDIQVIDQDDAQTRKRQTFETSRTQYNKWSIANLTCPLADKTNSVSISQSLKIVDDTKKVQCYTSMDKTSRSEQPLYVTEQYSRGRYEGYKQGGMRHGFGTFYYQQGGRYCGQWRRNKMQGRGALYYTNGELAYEGEWSQDQLHGYGVLYNEVPVYVSTGLNWRDLEKVGACWVKYEGNFVSDMRSGQGTLYLSNGEYFRGIFRDDVPNGHGMYRTLAGQVVRGCWREGHFQDIKI